MKLLRGVCINKITLHAVLVLFSLFLFGCSQGEPPLSLGEAEPGELMRHTKLTKLIGRDDGAASLAPGKVSSKYEINYPAQNLKSIADVSLVFGNMREEIFEGKWKIKYIYDGEWEGRGWHEAYGIPLTIEIYDYSSGNYSNLINTYRLSKIVTNYPIYKDDSGKEKTISTTYFSVSSGLR